jgi:competence protein ComEC
MGMSRFAKIIRFIIVSLTVWTYTALVGFTPSIMRAALMATIYELSSIIEREGSSLNTLSVSAHIITKAQPESLIELGFQLSFASLLAIIFIHPIIVKLNPSQNIIVKYLWNTISMSLACQIGTSIITIYNFRFVPTFF